MGTSWESLTEIRRRVLLMGLGSISGEIPMVCFTEVPDGRDIRDHFLQFGAYGIVVKRSWLDANGADRVIYFGQNSAVSQRIYKIVTGLHISNLHKNADGEVLFEKDTLSSALDLLAYIEVRENISEAEWRIAGNHGFMGGASDADKRLPLTLADIEAVLVQNAPDIDIVEGTIDRLAVEQGVTQTPKVLCQPQTL